MKSQVLYTVWYFWWGCRGNLTLITLRSERVNAARSCGTVHGQFCKWRLWCLYIEKATTAQVILSNCNTDFSVDFPGMSQQGFGVRSFQPNPAFGAQPFTMQQQQVQVHLSVGIEKWTIESNTTWQHFVPMCKAKKVISCDCLPDTLKFEHGVVKM